MSDIAVFGAGSIMFIATAWATIAFGLRRMHELQDEELERTGRTSREGESGLTELHVEAEEAT